MIEREFVLATANDDKVREITALMPHGYVLHARPEEVPPVQETGDTLAANARLKAAAICAATGMPALADDTGLEVDALDGAPGVYSARYAGEDADDAANNARLIAELAGVPDGQRTARFVSAVAFVTADGDEHVVRGTMEGRIVDAPAGDHGFGYDPYFVSDAAGDGRTNAQLSPDEKNALSHRGAAFRAIVPTIEDALR